LIFLISTFSVAGIIGVSCSAKIKLEMPFLSLMHGERRQMEELEITEKGAGIQT
jgi:hypothetical protein